VAPAPLAERMRARRAEIEEALRARVYAIADPSEAYAEGLLNSCKFAFNSTSNTPPLTGKMAISCAKPGDAIEVTANVWSCTVSLPEQAELGSVEFANTGKKSRGRTITVTESISGIKYTQTGRNCPNVGTHETAPMPAASSSADPAGREDIRTASMSPTNRSSSLPCSKASNTPPWSRRPSSSR
jgi:hypothetical protein